jgi:hypothetical protein
MALGLFACSTSLSKNDPSDPTTEDSDVGGSDTEDTPVADTDDPVVDPPDAPAPPASSDAQRVRDHLAAGGDLEALLQDVAWSGGWPVRTEAGFLVVVPSTTPLSIAGDFNDWQPVAMQSGPGVQWFEVTGTDGVGVGYKLDAGDGLFADPWARAYVHDAFGELSFLAAPTDRPHLERWPNWQGRGLAPREATVRVPAGQGPWPILLMHDGQNLFDPGAIHGGWQVGEALDDLGADVLVVGLWNTPDRVAEYTHVPDAVLGDAGLTPRGDDYADLVTLDVLPWAEGRWGVAPTIGVMGSSLGGLISLHIADRHPGV